MVLILDTCAYGAIKNGARMAALAVPTHGTARMNVLYRIPHPDRSMAPKSRNIRTVSCDAMGTTRDPNPYTYFKIESSIDILFV